MALKIAKLSQLQSKEQLKLLASQAFDRKDLVKAGEHLISALEKDPKDAGLFLQLGLVRMQQGELAQALIATTQAILLAPGNAAGFNLMGVLLYNLQAYQAAKRFFRRTLELEPGHGSAKNSVLDALKGVLDHGVEETSEQLDAVLKLLELKGPTLSLCMIVKNEEAFLDDCLSSVQDVVDEMIIVDTGSTDRTVSIAKAHGAKVLHYEWNDDFAAARNFGIDQATGDWILVLDADEEILPETRHELRQIIQNKDNVGYGILLESRLGNQGEGGAQTASVFRLFQNRPELRYEGIIHEQVAQKAIALDLPQGQSRVRILHKGYTEQMVSSRDKLQRNLTLLLRQAAEHPEMAYAHFNLGQTYKMMNDHVAAEAAYRKSLVLLKEQDYKTNTPFYASAYFGLGDTLRILGKLEETIQVADEALALYPTFPDLHYLKGVTLLAAERPQEALACFEKCRSLSGLIMMSGNDPDVPGYRSLNGMAAAYSKMNKTALARQFAQKAILECSRQDPEPHANLASLHLKEGNHGEALKGFAKALEIAENYAPGWRGLGAVYFETGHYLEALQALERTRELEPEAKGINALIGEACLLLGRLPRATAAYQTELALDPSGGAAYKYGLCLLITGDRAGARSLWQAHLSTAQDDLARQLQAGLLLVDKLDHEVPTGAEVEAIGLPYPKTAALWAGYFEIALRCKQTQGIFQLVEWARQLAGNGFPELACELGGVYLRYEIFDQALELLLLAQPHMASPDLYFRLGKAAAAKGFTENAQLMFKQCLILDPRHPRAGLEMVALRQKVLAKA